MKKDKFLMRCSNVHAMDDLSDEQVGKLLRGLVRYIETGDADLGDDPLLVFAFKFFKATEDAHREEYEEICRKKAEAGMKGAEKRWQK